MTRSINLDKLKLVHKLISCYNHALLSLGGIGVPSSVLNDPSSGPRLSISYLGVAERGERGEACTNGVGGGDGASTGSDSLVSSGQASGEETKTQKQKSPLLSPNMELERARAKIRLLQKEVWKSIPKFLYIIKLWDIFYEREVSFCTMFMSGLTW